MGVMLKDHEYLSLRGRKREIFGRRSVDVASAKAVTNFSGSKLKGGPRKRRVLL